MKEKYYSFLGNDYDGGILESEINGQVYKFHLLHNYIISGSMAFYISGTSREKWKDGIYLSEFCDPLYPIKYAGVTKHKEKLVFNYSTDGSFFNPLNVSTCTNLFGNTPPNNLDVSKTSFSVTQFLPYRKRPTLKNILFSGNCDGFIKKAGLSKPSTKNYLYPQYFNGQAENFVGREEFQENTIICPEEFKRETFSYGESYNLFEIEKQYGKNLPELLSDFENTVRYSIQLKANYLIRSGDIHSSYPDVSFYSTATISEYSSELSFSFGSGVDVYEIETSTSILNSTSKKLDSSTIGENVWVRSGSKYVLPNTLTNNALNRFTSFQEITNFTPEIIAGPQLYYSTIGSETTKYVIFKKIVNPENENDFYLSPITNLNGIILFKGAYSEFSKTQVNVASHDVGEFNIKKIGNKWRMNFEFHSRRLYLPISFADGKYNYSNTIFQPPIKWGYFESDGDFENGELILKYIPYSDDDPSIGKISNITIKEMTYNSSFPENTYSTLINDDRVGPRFVDGLSIPSDSYSNKYHILPNKWNEEVYVCTDNITWTIVI